MWLKPLQINIKFTIVTNCQALIYFNAHRTINSHISRWGCLFSEKKLQIVHRPGIKLPHVSAINQVQVESPEVNVEKLLVLTVVSLEDEVTMYQYADYELKPKREILQKPEEIRTIRARICFT